MVSQGLLFSEPSVAETGVWCALSEGIDPSQWARLCRYIGTRNREEFELIFDTTMAGSQLRKERHFYPKKESHMPLISVGPSGIGGQFQTESF
ncbi:MAG: hypothetical protein JXA96_01850 [Sedimentisphaerales bacterium]|nr:hypothetical protein [Sedimentisphaerales bacterium]